MASGLYRTALRLRLAAIANHRISGCGGVEGEGAAKSVSYLEAYDVHIEHLYKERGRVFKKVRSSSGQLVLLWDSQNKTITRLGYYCAP